MNFAYLMSMQLSLPSVDTWQKVAADVRRHEGEPSTLTDFEGKKVEMVWVKVRDIDHAKDILERICGFPGVDCISVSITKLTAE